MKVLLVHNPTAGEGEISAEELTTLLHKAQLTPTYQSSKIGELTAALAEARDMIVVAGGDGTVAKVLTQLPDRSIPVGILPLGTANNIATSFGIGGRLDEIAIGLRGAERRPLDLGVARGPWGCARIVEGVGLGALVRTAQRVGKPDGTREERIKAARKAIRQEIAEAEGDRLQILVDDEPMPEEYLFVEILNVVCGGPRLRLAPQTDPGDGLLEVVMLEPHRRKEMARWLKNRPADEPPPLTTRRGRKISLVWDGTPMHVDDDIPPAEEGLVAVEVELEPDPVTILVSRSPGEPGVAEPVGGES